MSETIHLYVIDGSGTRAATEADLAAAGYVKRELLEESERDHQSTWAKMMRQAENLTGLNASLQSTRQDLISTRGQLADVTAKLRAAELTLELHIQGAEVVADRLEAAEGRVRELERELAERWMTEEELATRFPAPEAAKPAEHTCSEGDDTRHCAACDEAYERETGPVSQVAQGECRVCSGSGWHGEKRRTKKAKKR